MLCRWDELPDFMKKAEIRRYYRILERHRPALFIKRCFDFTVSSVLLIFLAPLFFLLALLIRLDSAGPVFYRQERVTQYGRRFQIYKFRTMREDADRVGGLITTEGDSRITRMGKRLRGCRLDELPQLINIWKGEMTFVGTRPEVVRYVRHYTNEMRATLLLPAGVTSRASIAYRDEDRLMAEKIREGKTADEAYVKDVLPEKMKYNLRDLECFSLADQFLLLFKTVAAVFPGKERRQNE